MSNQAQVRLIRIFVSCPGDVDDERRALDEVVRALNRTLGEHHGVRLETFHWKDNVLPQIGPAPQDVVDGQTPLCDIYLGIMASRFGTPTKPYGSGTEKELRDAIGRWAATGAPWILFYFKDNPALSGKANDARQYLAVCELREELESRGLVRTYTDTRGSADGFYEQAQQHLSRLLLNLSGPRESAASPPAGDGGVPEEYRRKLGAQCEDIGLLGLEIKEGHAVQLQQVYVPQTTPARASEMDDAAARPSPDAEREAPQLLLDLLAQQSLYVSGAPGSGKSTFCRWLTWLVCTGYMPESVINGAPEYMESYPEALRERLPLLVKLREFWPFLPATPQKQTLTRRELETAIGTWVAQSGAGPIAVSAVVAGLAAGTALLVLDGLDEVPISQGKEDRQSYPRAMLLSGLANATSGWVEAGNRILITSRPGIARADRDRLGLLQAPIAELDTALQVILVRRWFAILARGTEVADTLSEQVLSEIRGRDELQELIANPMLLTGICVIYSQDKRLPQDKYELYHRIVDYVLYNRFLDPKAIELQRSRLSVVAHGMHTGSGLQESRVTPQAEATHDEVDRILKDFISRGPRTQSGHVSVIDARERLLSDSGLLLSTGEKKAFFYHLSFQEFLAAQWIDETDRERLVEVFRQRADAPEWHNTLVFVFGGLFFKSVSPNRAIRLLEDLIDHVDPGDLGLAMVVVECLRIVIAREYRLKNDAEERFRAICLAAIENEVPLAERYQLGLGLGLLGDPRVAEDLRVGHNPPAYVEIAAGDYLLGEPAEEHAIPQTFHLGRFPVTNVQYAVFVDNGGYTTRKWWSATGWQWLEETKVTRPRYWDAANLNESTMPVVGVCYWEAEAFAAWAGGRLPTEWEWEAAARGPQGRIYPWGDEWQPDACNSEESSVRGLAPVGLFPTGKSPFDAEDMSGNVWEWCDSKSRSNRVLRGGWVYGRLTCRAFSRLVYSRHARSVSIGFRVCLSSPIEND